MLQRGRVPVSTGDISTASRLARPSLLPRQSLSTSGMGSGSLLGIPRELIGGGDGGLFGGLGGRDAEPSVNVGITRNIPSETDIFGTAFSAADQYALGQAGGPGAAYGAYFNLPFFLAQIANLQDQPGDGGGGGGGTGGGFGGIGGGYHLPFNFPAQYPSGIGTGSGPHINAGNRFSIGGGQPASRGLSFTPTTFSNFSIPKLNLGGTTTTTPPPATSPSPSPGGPYPVPSVPVTPAPTTPTPTNPAPAPTNPAPTTPPPATTTPPPAQGDTQIAHPNPHVGEPGQRYGRIDDTSFLGRSGLFGEDNYLSEAVNTAGLNFQTQDLIPELARIARASDTTGFGQIGDVAGNDPANIGFASIANPEILAHAFTQLEQKDPALLARILEIAGAAYGPTAELGKQTFLTRLRRLQPLSVQNQGTRQQLV